MPLTLPLDLTGTAASNLRSNEAHAITDYSSRFFVPEAGPFFTKGMILRKPDGSPMQPGQDYKALHLSTDGVNQSGKEVCCLLYVHNEAIAGNITATYQAIGGPYTATVPALEQLLENLSITNGNQVHWAQIVDAPVQYPPTQHPHHSKSIFGMNDIVGSLNGVSNAILASDGSIFQMMYQYVDMAIENALGGGEDIDAEIAAIWVAINNHLTSNTAHAKAAVGLSNVMNYGMATMANVSSAAAADVVTNAYMSPALASELIKKMVTKLLIGLDKVNNFGIALPAEVASAAAAEAATQSYMTPQRTKALITAMGMVYTNLQDFAVASESEALEGSASNKYMTPQRTTLTVVSRGHSSMAPSSGQSPNTTLDPILFVDWNKHNSSLPDVVKPDGTTISTTAVGYKGLIRTAFQKAVNAAITPTTPRVQYLYPVTGTGAGALEHETYMTRSFDIDVAGAWSPWKPVANKGSVGLSNLNNWPVATNAQALEGIPNVYADAAAARLAAIGVMRQAGVYESSDPSSTLLPVILSAHINGPTGNATDRFVIVTTFNPTDAATPNTIATPRVQIAYGINLNGMWRREYTSNWSSWQNQISAPENLQTPRVRRSYDPEKYDNATGGYPYTGEISAVDTNFDCSIAIRKIQRPSNNWAFSFIPFIRGEVTVGGGIIGAKPTGMTDVNNAAFTVTDVGIFRGEDSGYGANNYAVFTAWNDDRESVHTDGGSGYYSALMHHTVNVETGAVSNANTIFRIGGSYRIANILTHPHPYGNSRSDTAITNNDRQSAYYGVAVLKAEDNPFNTKLGVAILKTDRGVNHSAGLQFGRSPVYNQNTGMSNGAAAWMANNASVNDSSIEQYLIPIASGNAAIGTMTKLIQSRSRWYGFDMGMHMLLYLDGSGLAGSGSKFGFTTLVPDLVSSNLGNYTAVEKVNLRKYSYTPNDAPNGYPKAFCFIGHEHLAILTNNNISICKNYSDNAVSAALNFTPIIDLVELGFADADPKTFDYVNGCFILSGVAIPWNTITGVVGTVVKHPTYYSQLKALASAKGRHFNGIFEMSF